MLSGCGSGGSTETTAGPGNRPTQEDLGQLRDAVVRGVAEDFRGGTHAGPRRFDLCLRLGVRRALTVDEIDRLVSVYRRPGGQQFAAQALNELAAPVGAECGGARFVPEWWPPRKRSVAGTRSVASTARRGGSGSSTGRIWGSPATGPTRPDAESIGIDLVLRSDATSVRARVGGRPVDLRTPGLHTGDAGRDWVGYLHHAGFHRRGSAFFISPAGRGPQIWAGQPPVYLPVRLAIATAEEGRVTGRLGGVFLSPGWG